MAKTKARRAGTRGILYPLDLVYARAGVTLPKVKVVTPKQIPEPYRSLLVHDVDMTMTLERHFGDRVALRPLSTFTVGHSYFRRVLLVQEYSGRPVEMGAIRIRLDAFSQRVQAKIRNAAEFKVPYVLVVGPRDAENEAVSVRAFGIDKDLGAMPLSEFVETIQTEISTRGGERVISRFETAGVQPLRGDG